MSRDRNYQDGDNYLIDDITGQKIRASDAVKMWNGLWTHQDNYNDRHPQDFVKALADHEAAEIVRPRSPDIQTGPTVVSAAAAASPGDIGIKLSSSSGFQVGDSITIMLANGDTFRTTINGMYEVGFLLTEDGNRIELEDGSGYLLFEDQTAINHIGLTDPLPYGVEAGAAVINYTQSVAATL